MSDIAQLANNSPIGTVISANAGQFMGVVVAPGTLIVIGGPGAGAVVQFSGDQNTITINSAELGLDMSYTTVPNGVTSTMSSPGVIPTTSTVVADPSSGAITASIS